VGYIWRKGIEMSTKYICSSFLECDNEIYNGIGCSGYLMEGLLSSWWDMNWFLCHALREKGVFVSVAWVFACKCTSFWPQSHSIIKNH
jgi:hypothetical protein